MPAGQSVQRVTGTGAKRLNLPVCRRAKLIGTIQLGGRILYDFLTIFPLAGCQAENMPGIKAFADPPVPSNYGFRRLQREIRIGRLRPRAGRVRRLYTSLWGCRDNENSGHWHCQLRRCLNLLWQSAIVLLRQCADFPLAGCQAEYMPGITAFAAPPFPIKLWLWAPTA